MSERRRFTSRKPPEKRVEEFNHEEKEHAVARIRKAARACGREMDEFFAMAGCKFDFSMFRPHRALDKSKMRLLAEHYDLPYEWIMGKAWDFHDREVLLDAHWLGKCNRKN